MTIVTDPVLAPITFGVKLTVIVQLAAAATDVPQSLVCAKSPLATILEKFNEALPVFVSVTICESPVVPTSCATNVKLVEVKLTAGAMPVPDRATICGLLGSFESMVSIPVRAPPAVGVKVTLNVQLADAASEAQSLV